VRCMARPFGSRSSSWRRPGPAGILLVIARKGRPAWSDHEPVHESVIGTPQPHSVSGVGHDVVEESCRCRCR
jgi:hypothetical protein